MEERDKDNIETLLMGMQSDDTHIKWISQKGYEAKLPEFKEMYSIEELKPYHEQYATLCVDYK